MKELHFSKTYFRNLIFDDTAAGLRIVIRERPSLSIVSEEYSLRAALRLAQDPPLHREFAIEHHLPPSVHAFPHLQFKLHSEQIGQIHLRLDVESLGQYRKAILGFIFQIRESLAFLESLRPGIVDEILVSDLVKQLAPEGAYLMSLIHDGILRYSVELRPTASLRAVKPLLPENPFLISFLGKENLEILGEKIDKKMSNRR